MARWWMLLERGKSGVPNTVTTPAIVQHNSCSISDSHTSNNMFGPPHYLLIPSANHTNLCCQPSIQHNGIQIDIPRFILPLDFFFIWSWFLKVNNILVSGTQLFNTIFIKVNITWFKGMMPNISSTNKRTKCPLLFFTTYLLNELTKWALFYHTTRYNKTASLNQSVSL